MSEKQVYRKAGARVFVWYTDGIPGGKEEKRYGTIQFDEGLWDYTDVCFDDSPTWVQPILAYYLFDADDDNKD